MSLKTKLNPLGGRKSGGKYSAYLVFSNKSVINVRSLGFTEDIDPEKTKGSDDELSRCNLYILNGKLFQYYDSTLTQVDLPLELDDQTLFTAVAGVSGSTDYGYAIWANRLFYVRNGQTGPMSETQNYNCTEIKGKPVLNSGSSTLAVFSNGYLYRLSSTSANRITISSYSFSTVSAGLFGIEPSCYTLYINSGNGRLGAFYYYNGNPAYTALQSFNPKIIKGICRISKSEGAYMIDTSDKLYTIYVNGSTLTRATVNTDKTWSNVTGSYGAGFAIANDGLYRLTGTTAAQIDSTKEWTSVVPSGVQGTQGYAIGDGDLYYINSDNSLERVLKNCIGFYGYAGSVSGVDCPALAICEN